MYVKYALKIYNIMICTIKKIMNTVNRKHMHSFFSFSFHLVYMHFLVFKLILIT